MSTSGPRDPHASSIPGEQVQAPRRGRCTAEEVQEGVSDSEGVRECANCAGGIGTTRVDGANRFETDATLP